MFRKRLIAALMLPIAAQAQLSQEQVNQFAANTEFMFAVEDNFHNKDSSFLGSITLTNRSDVALPAGQGDWQIYLHNVRKMKEQSVKGLRIEHVNGDLHRLIPTSDFAGLASGETLVIPFEASVWIVAYSDFMPRAFVVAKDTKPAILLIPTARILVTSLPLLVSPSSSAVTTTPKIKPSWLMQRCVLSVTKV